MIDWINWGLGILQGTIVSIIGGVVIFYVLIPKMTKNTTRRTIEELKRDPEIKPLIDKAKEMVVAAHPLVEQFKHFDLKKLQKDFQPLLDGIKTIDPKEIEGLMKSLRELTGTVKTALEKPPKIPEPEET